MKSCTKFSECSAPLCPLDKTLEVGMWYPDEPICAKHNHEWIKTQRKIAERTREPEKYFTYEMLNRNCVIGRAMAGLDPEKPRDEELKKWLAKHPPKKKRELSEEERQKLAKRLKPDTVRKVS